MDIMQFVPLVILVAVLGVSAWPRISRPGVAWIGALLLILSMGLGQAIHDQIPEALLTSAALMILAGAVKRSGLASWLSLRAAKLGKGHPRRILVLLGLLTYAFAALFGPGVAVVLGVPVALLLAVELDVAGMPFVVVLSWSALLGAATVLTAQPSNLWVGLSLGIGDANWFLRMAPLTLSLLAVTLGLGSLLFRNQLRVTHERRARVLEYQAGRALGERSQIVRTLVVLFLVGLTSTLGSFTGWSPAVVLTAGAVALIVLEGPKGFDLGLSDINGPQLAGYSALFVVVGALASTVWPETLAQALPANPVGLLWSSALLGAGLDHGVVSGTLVPLLQAWKPSPSLWAMAVLGSTLGAGATVWGAASNASALSFSSPGRAGAGWKEFTRLGLLFATTNLAFTTVLVLLWPL